MDIAADTCAIVDVIIFVLGEKYEGTEKERESIRKVLKHSIIAALNDSEDE